MTVAKLGWRSRVLLFQSLSGCTSLVQTNEQDTG